MILTDKCKEDFNKWVVKKYPLLRYLNTEEGAFLNKLETTLIIEFFDSVGITINIIVEYDRKGGYVRGFDSEVCFIMYRDFLVINSDCLKNDVYETRQEATEEAIKKANEIYNKN